MAAIIFACEEIWLWIYKESITIPPRNHFGVFKYQNQPETKRRGNSNPPVFVFQSGLIVACYHGYVDVVIALSQCPYVDVNWQDNEGNTALITAAQAGNPPPTSLFCSVMVYDMINQSHHKVAALSLLLSQFADFVTLLCYWNTNQCHATNKRDVHEPTSSYKTYREVTHVTCQERWL